MLQTIRTPGGTRIEEISKKRGERFIDLPHLSRIVRIWATLRKLSQNSVVKSPIIVLSFPFPSLPPSSLVISVLRLLGRSEQGGIYVRLSLGKPWQPEQGLTKVSGGA